MPLRLRMFRSVVWEYWKRNGRHELPWRKTKDPYRILVSEVMLQQTQVPRVIEKYKEFLKKFPTVRALAKASLADVLKVWSGLGYNRRAKYLHDAAKALVHDYKRPYLTDAAAFDKYKGIGPYTRAAVRVFAFNEPHIMIETNIRAAYIHHFFNVRPTRSNITHKSDLWVSDKQIVPLATKAAEGQDPRKWHWALMDYGAYLKRSGVRNNSRSAHYTKQSTFEGSLRQVRGAILRELHNSSQAEKPLLARLNLANPKSDFGKRALAGLERDGLIEKENGKWKIA